LSIELAKKALGKFIGTSAAETICIRGKWGVGKTYACKQYLNEAIEKRTVALPYYSYVSLFGLNSADTLRQAIFENLNPTQAEASTYTFDDRLTLLAKRGGQFASKISSVTDNLKLPLVDAYVRTISGGIRQIVALTISRTIIFIDDFERKGRDLKVTDILGVISELKEEKQCKILLIMNMDVLSAMDKTDFDTYFEKVIDISLEFAPTAEEIVGIALSGKGQIYDWLRSDCIQLKILNIRIIRKIERLIHQLYPIVDTLDSSVMRNIVHEVVLFGWSVYSGEGAPTLEYLTYKRYRQRFLSQERANSSEVELRWRLIPLTQGDL
jgi:KAP family P-loop domain